MTPDGRRAYAAMLEASRALGLPRSFRTDLTTHDRAFCSKLGPEDRFVWAPYEHGTHLARIVDFRYAPLLRLLPALEELGAIAFYYWNGKELIKTSAEYLRSRARDSLEQEQIQPDRYDERDTYEPSGAEYL